MGRCLGPRQRLFDVRDQIALILDPHRNPHQSAGDAQCLFLVFGQALVRRRGRVCHDGFGIAQIVGNRAQGQRIQEPERRLLATGQIKSTEPCRP